MCHHCGRSFEDASGLSADFLGKEGGEAGEGVAGSQADQSADQDVSQIVLADEYAADSYQWSPNEHPYAVGLQP